MAERESLERMPKDDEVRHYLAEQQLYDKQHDAWITRAKQYTEDYRRDSGEAEKARRFPIFWSNTEILKAATFNQSPQPDVSRRWQFTDDGSQKVALDAAIIMEKVLRFNADQTDQFEVPIEQSNQDALIPGRGTARVDLEQEFQEFDDGSEQVTDQRAPLKYVYWQDFSHSPARIWSDVRWIRYRHLMTRDDLRKHRATKAAADKIPLTVKIGARNDLMIVDPKDKADQPATFGRAEVWEFWDKEKGEIIWLARGWDKVLHKEQPLITFNDFFDCPPPLIYGSTNDTMVPLPDYGRYVALAEELDALTARAAGIISQIKACGAYDGVLKNFPDIARLADGEFVPLGQGAGTEGGIDKKIFQWPIETQVVVLRELLLQREQVKQSIFEITGISDIVRGSTNPNETLGAQELKGQFASFRLSGKQNAMRRFVQRCLQLQGEVAAELYSTETLGRITGEEITDEIMALLRDERMRGYRVDVSLEELVRPDQERQKQTAIEYLGAMQSFFAEALPTIQVMPAVAPLIGEMVKFANRQFKAGRELEETVDRTMDQLVEQASQPQEPPGPDPDAQLKAETALEQEQMRQQGANQREVAKAATAVQLEQVRARRQVGTSK